jgi:N-acetylneuraminic acid mutarotase
MKRVSALVLPVLFATFFFADSLPGFEPLPSPVSNNAVAGVKYQRRFYLVSLMGIGPKKTWNAVTNATYFLDSNTQSWSQGRPVPGPVGRIAAAAAGANEQIFLFGGAVIDAQNRERMVSDVNVYQPGDDRWYSGADLPVAVADAVAGVFRDRFIYLIGGGTNGGPVNNVQVYDTEKDRWQQATPMPGPPVYGHAGAVVDDTILYVDGAQQNPARQPAFVASDECWIGRIDHKDPVKIAWSKLASHPGNARFRIAAGGSDKDKKIYFAGGSNAPYLDNGMGYDGKPAEPIAMAFDFNLRSQKWELISESLPKPRMDAHILLITPEGLLLVGGMTSGQTVTAEVSLLPKEARNK